MSERVERKILGLFADHHNSPYGNPIPGLDSAGEEPGRTSGPGVSTLLELAGDEPRLSMGYTG